MSFIKIYIIITILNSFFYIKIKNSLQYKLRLILILNLLSELLIYFFIKTKLSIIPYYSFYFIIHQAFWLNLILYFYESKKLNYILYIYVLYFFVDILIISGYKTLNYNAFIIGALLYIILFTYLSFLKLKYEDLKFFLSSDFIILFAPVLFFFGFSFMFAYKNYNLLSEKTILNIQLYDIISYFVNFTYYTFINIYIYKERKTNG